MSVLDRFRLDGRTAIVTGIGPGVGEHVAKAYAELGANVVCASRNAANYERVAREINAAGGRAVGVPCDVGDKAQREQLVKAARDAFGPIHILFNNAAAGVMDINKSFWDTDDEIWDVALGVNVLAPFHLAKLVFPDMEQHGKDASSTWRAAAALHR